jgi:hypothetical protein
MLPPRINRILVLEREMCMWRRILFGKMGERILEAITTALNKIAENDRYSGTNTGNFLVVFKN